MSGKTNETIRINDTEDWDALLDEILSDAGRRRMRVGFRHDG